MSWLSNLFAHNKNPADSANNYLNKIPDETKPYYDPYINAGKESLDTLKDQYGQMTNNPGEFYNKIGAGYKESPGYQAALRQALSGANNAAAMGGGGGLGSPGAINNSAQAAGDVANQDFEKYINHVLGLHTEGLGGQQTLETQGQNAGADYASMLAQLRNAQANNAFNATSGENQQRGQNWQNIFRLGGTIAGTLAGGPFGALAGGGLGSSMYGGG